MRYNIIYVHNIIIIIMHTESRVRDIAHILFISRGPRAGEGRGGGRGGGAVSGSCMQEWGRGTSLTTLYLLY